MKKQCENCDGDGVIRYRNTRNERDEKARFCPTCPHPAPKGGKKE